MYNPDYPQAGYLPPQPQQQQLPPPATFQPPIIIAAPNSNQPHQSCGLIGVGIFQIILSIGSIGLSAYVISKVNFTSFAIAELVCGLIFLVMAIFSIHGGNDVWKRHCSISTAATLGVFGVLAAVAAIVTNIIAILDYPNQCERVKLQIDAHGIGIDINEMCYMAYIPIHVTLTILAVLEAFFGLIISCAACCNVCACCCCYKAPPSNAPQIFQSPPAMLHLGARGDQYAYAPLNA